MNVSPRRCPHAGVTAPLCLFSPSPGGEIFLFACWRGSVAGGSCGSWAWPYRGGVSRCSPPLCALLPLGLLPRLGLLSPRKHDSHRRPLPGQLCVEELSPAALGLQHRGRPGSRGRSQFPQAQLADSGHPAPHLWSLFCVFSQDSMCGSEFSLALHTGPIHRPRCDWISAGPLGEVCGYWPCSTGSPVCHQRPRSRQSDRCGDQLQPPVSLYFTPREGKQIVLY